MLNCIYTTLGPVPIQLNKGELLGYKYTFVCSTDLLKHAQYYMYIHVMEMKIVLYSSWWRSSFPRYQEIVGYCIGRFISPLLMALSFMSLEVVQGNQRVHVCPLQSKLCNHIKETIILSNAYYTMHYGDRVHPILGGCGLIALEKCYHFFLLMVLLFIFLEVVQGH